MKLIVCLIAALVFFFVFENTIKKHAVAFYIGTVAISIFSIVAPVKALPFPVSYIITSILDRGTLAGALILLVMIASVCPIKSMHAMLLRTRGEMAIIAALFTLIHNIAYGKKYFTALFIKPASMPIPVIIASILSLIMILLLLPLTITSFMTVRRKMNAKKWKSLQKLSYIFYGLLLLHIIMIFSVSIFKGYLDVLFDLAVYIVFYIVYLFFRGRKIKKQRVICSILGVIIIAVYVIISVFGIKAYSAQDKEEKEAITETVKETASETSAGDTSYKDGTYEGSAGGYAGKIKVSVTVSGGKITEIKILSNEEDEEYFIDAKDVIPDIIEKQSLDVDNVSGATHSAKGIIKAVGNALENAK